MDAGVVRNGGLLGRMGDRGLSEHEDTCGTFIGFVPMGSSVLPWVTQLRVHARDLRGRQTGIGERLLLKVVKVVLHIEEDVCHTSGPRGGSGYYCVAG